MVETKVELLSQSIYYVVIENVSWSHSEFRIYEAYKRKNKEVSKWPDDSSTMSHSDA